MAYYNPITRLIEPEYGDPEWPDGAPISVQEPSGAPTGVYEPPQEAMSLDEALAQEEYLGGSVPARGLDRYAFDMRPAAVSPDRPRGYYVPGVSERLAEGMGLDWDDVYRQGLGRRPAGRPARIPDVEPTSLEDIGEVLGRLTAPQPPATGILGVLEALPPTIGPIGVPLKGAAGVVARLGAGLVGDVVPEVGAAARQIGKRAGEAAAPAVGAAGRVAREAAEEALPAARRFLADEAGEVRLGGSWPGGKVPWEPTIQPEPGRRVAEAIKRQKEYAEEQARRKAEGWEKSVAPDGEITYTRPGAPAEETPNAAETAALDFRKGGKGGKAKPMNAAAGERALKKLEDEGWDVEDARQALDEYRDVERDAFDDATEYREARQEAWDSFLDQLEGAAPPEAAATGPVSRDRVAQALRGELDPNTLTDPEIDSYWRLRSPAKEAQDLAAAQARLEAARAYKLREAEGAPVSPSGATAGRNVEETRGPYSQFLIDIQALAGRHPNRRIERAIQAYDDGVISRQELIQFVEETDPQFRSGLLGFSRDTDFQRYLDHWRGTPDVGGSIRANAETALEREMMEELLLPSSSAPTGPARVETPLEQELMAEGSPNAAEAILEHASIKDALAAYAQEPNNTGLFIRWDERPLQPGEQLPPSRTWEDGRPLEVTEHGTSAINPAYRHFSNADLYSLYMGTPYLVRGEVVGRGADPGEVLLRNATVVKALGKAPPGAPAEGPAGVASRAAPEPLPGVQGTLVSEPARAGTAPPAGAGPKLTTEEVRAAVGAGVPLSPGPGGAAAVREALAGGGTPRYGTMLPGGEIAGQAPVTPTAREFWARPLSNDDMVTGTFRDNFWRRNVDRPGLRQFTSAIDPAALVSGIATDAVSVVKRGLLLRNRVLDVGDTGVQAGMAFLREQGSRFGVGRNSPFVFNGEGRINGRLWADLFDAPGSTTLTSNQRAYIELYQGMIDDALKLARDNGIEIKELGLEPGRHYIPRMVEAIRGIEKEQAGRVGGRVGAKAGLQKTRWYEWAEDGVKAGVVYSNDPLTVMEHHVQSIYRLVADKRLADTVNPLGQTITERMPPGVIKAAQAAKIRYDHAKQLLAAVNRSYRGERLPPSTLASIARDYPDEAAALRAAGPDNPALQAVETQARTLMAASRGDWGRAVGLRALAREKAGILALDEVYIPQPFAGGRIFPKAVADAVTASVGDQGNAWLRWLQKPNDVSRTIGTIFDFGAPLVQGFSVLGGHPDLWAKATLRHYRAFIEPGAKQRFFTQHAESLKSMAQHGVSIGGSEFLAGERPARGLVKLLPKQGQVVTSWLGKQTAGRFQESFGTFLDTSAVYLWEALEPRALREGPESLYALGDLVNHLRGTMSQRAIGVGTTQQQIEGVFGAFAPRYTKAGFALLADFMQGGLKGAEARRAMVGMGNAGILGFLGAATALGLPLDEVQDRLKPIKNGRFNAKFMTVPNGTDNVGFGSFFYSWLRFMAGTVDSALNAPEEFLSLDPQDNPLVGMARGRLVGASAISSLAIELATQHTYFGEKLTTTLDYAKAVIRRGIPFWAESYFMQEPPLAPPSAPAVATGFRVFPSSYGARATELEKRLATEQGLRGILTRDDRRRLEEASPELRDLREKAQLQAEGRVKNPVQQDTADYFADFDRNKVAREKELEPFYRGYLTGKMGGKELMDLRSKAMDRFSGTADRARQTYPLALVDRTSREEYYRQKRIEIKEGAPEDLAAEGYYNIRPPADETGMDWKAFRDTREKYLGQFDAKTQDYILHKYLAKRFEQPWMNELEKQIQQDMDILRPYLEMWDTVAVSQAMRDKMAELTAAERQGDLAAVKRLQSQGWFADYKTRVTNERDRLRRRDKEVQAAGERWYEWKKPGAASGSSPYGNPAYGAPAWGTSAYGVPAR